jgi:hypothetical protein
VEKIYAGFYLFSHFSLGDDDVQRPVYEMQDTTKKHDVLFLYYDEVCAVDQLLRPVQT